MSQKKKSIEELITRLEEITREIENPDTGVEKSIKLYEEGLKLADLCKERLNDARRKLEVIDPGATPPTEKKPAENNDLFSGTDQAPPSSL
ncbi:exodeoxyribonuclease VII small subunit [Prosthecochloris sp. N3]|uniref:Exodeoxyribonuclease 7 small subunit n=1 Tax=Prosthecochloris ethylica TaxID=2743976 RepID=A0ABR9XP40_9CHLB|nr:MULTISPECIES: exodeoxyribonuclease VII small subunit [Prosthecochloris]MEC9486419.1 exodeoxyribonuclease VII small subunit [Prosthecochloris sp.]MBF0585881.1 exodeoxyribonuclease VII small subunit [Prosthecochloris ethylica]MBF0635791.1 exodeoxyribonuclease VII small subunit [Prosthecochloris ethylica]NUK47089.1 exodeoxyribonuclease VII small subunit [Prosthecochloris ethylica]RNA65567.1 exodeoxyribonuclease VII small subunit [Prosthecochloris sp. ZM_2]